MAPVLGELLDPGHTALVTQECQRGVIGDLSVLPDLAAAARQAGVHDNGGRLADAARSAGVAVVHCVAARRADNRGANRNARLFAALLRQPPMLPGSDAVAVVPEIGEADSDLVLTRLHGLGPMGGTDLDAVLRNLGVRTIVGIGVSLNVGMLSLALDAVNAGYQVVIPTDAVAGVPADYGEAVLRHTIGLIATLTTADEVIGAWKDHPAGGAP